MRAPGQAGYHRCVLYIQICVVIHLRYLLNCASSASTRCIKSSSSRSCCCRWAAADFLSAFLSALSSALSFFISLMRSLRASSMSPAGPRRSYDGPASRVGGKLAIASSAQPRRENRTAEFASVCVGLPFPSMQIPGFCGGSRTFSVLIVAATMVIFDETEDTPRRVWVKKYTVQAHARTPPGRKHEGTANFSWKKHEKKHRKKKPEAKK